MTTIADSDSGMQGQTQEAVAASNDARRRRWVHLLGSQHYEPVIFDVLNGELTKYMNSRAVDPTDIVSHMRECALILASAPKVFLAAVEGNLVSRMTLDADLQAEYAVMQQRANYQPSIYIHLLADEEGQAPSPVQYLLIRDMIEDYISGCPSEHAHQIDDITPPFALLEASIQGYRKYLSTQSTNRSIKRLAVFNRLIAGIVSRCAQLPPHLQNQPLSYPPSEVGYALNAHKRLAQHRAHQSSNYVMNLVEDICTYLFRTKVLPQHFKMHQYIVYLIFRPGQAAITEIFCSGLLQCWVDLGGFNAYPAGRSVASSQRVTFEEWEAFRTIARELSPLKGNMEVLKERAETWRKALDWEHGNEEEKMANEALETALGSMDVT
jgi:hypothetical protein